jgi:hypothetical protein
MIFKKTVVFGSLLLLSGFSNADNSGRNVQEKIIVDMGAPSAKLQAKQMRELPRPTAEVHPMAPAPALTYLQVAYVGSSNIGWEGVSGFQTSTAADHGGTQLRIVTEELGYGSIPVATWNGGVVSSAKNYQTDTICVNWAGTGYDIPCLAGQTVVGFRKYWNFDGYQSGSFTYQNTSTNSPGNTMNDSMLVK